MSEESAQFPKLTISPCNENSLDKRLDISVGLLIEGQAGPDEVGEEAAKEGTGGAEGAIEVNAVEADESTEEQTPMSNKSKQSRAEEDEGMNELWDIFRSGNSSIGPVLAALIPIIEIIDQSSDN
jgi:hypothetical protein